MNETPWADFLYHTDNNFNIGSFLETNISSGTDINCAWEGIIEIVHAHDPTIKGDAIQEYLEVNMNDTDFINSGVLDDINNQSITNVFYLLHIKQDCIQSAETGFQLEDNMPDANIVSNPAQATSIYGS